MSLINEAWLQQRTEAALEPDLPIIDSHVHMWPLHPERGYRYLEDELGGDLGAGHNIVATVYAQGRIRYRESGPEHLKPVGETEWANAIAEHQAKNAPDGPVICAAIVSYADLLLGDKVDEVLEAHQAAAPARFRSIRYGTTWSDEQSIKDSRSRIFMRGLLLDAGFRKGFACLARRGLSFDGWVFHPQIPEFTDLARTFPDTPMVLDHLGVPLGKGSYARRGREVFEVWNKSIIELARCPNVHMKLGGSRIPVFGYDWESRPLPPSSDELVAATGHYYLAAIDAFSPARCMFESNFPVEKQACAYVPLWNSFKKLAARFSPTERADLFMNTAARFYHLESVATASKGRKR